MSDLPAEGRLPQVGPMHRLNEADLTPEQHEFAELLGRLLAARWQGRGLNAIARDAQLHRRDDVNTEIG